MNEEKGCLRRFTCYITRDLRRKRKRWADGTLEVPACGISGKAILRDEESNVVESMYMPASKIEKMIEDGESSAFERYAVSDVEKKSSFASATDSSTGNATTSRPRRYVNTAPSQIQSTRTVSQFRISEKKGTIYCGGDTLPLTDVTRANRTKKTSTFPKRSAEDILRLLMGNPTRSDKTTSKVHVEKTHCVVNSGVAKDVVPARSTSVARGGYGKRRRFSAPRPLTSSETERIPHASRSCNRESGATSTKRLASSVSFCFKFTCERNDRRRVSSYSTPLPETYESLDSYTATMMRALQGEMQAEISKVCEPIFHPRRDRGNGDENRADTVVCADDLVRRCRKLRVLCARKATLVRFTKKMTREEIDEIGDDGASKKKTSRFFMNVPSSAASDLSKQSKHPDCEDLAKGDIWIVLLSKSNAHSSYCARCGTTHVFADAFGVQSLWHGMSSSDGRMEIGKIFHDARMPRFREGKYKNELSAFAVVRGPNLSGPLSELSVLEKIGRGEISQRQRALLLELIGGGRKFSDSGGGDIVAARSRSSWHAFDLPSTRNARKVDVSEIARGVVRDFTLNSDQSSVVRIVAGWFAESDDDDDGNASTSRFALTHGIFGSGKSHLLVAVVHLLHRIGQARGRPIRVLCASATNVAVDRVLLGILERGEIERFQRIGSAKKVAKPILRYMPIFERRGVLSETAKEENARLLRDLKMMRASSRSRVDRVHVDAALARIEDKGQKKKQKKRDGKRSIDDHSNSQSHVFGVTCASSGSSLLTGRVFDVVVLDECSQMTEPCSLMPLVRSQCRRALLVGDPRQLPPVCANARLSKTLFDRMLQTGSCPSVMLRRQYRCHPLIANLASELFYESNVLNGVASDDRPSMLSALGPVTFVDVPRGRSMGRGSLSNPEEAKEVCAWVRTALSAVDRERRKRRGESEARDGDERADNEGGDSRDTEAASIGVITMYHAQARAIRRALEREVGPRAAEVQVSTVDAFQGQERDVIVISTVVTSDTASTFDGSKASSRSRRSVRFVSQDERVCVALTRAKRHLIVVGSKRRLETARVWSAVMRVAESAGGAFYGDGAGIRARHKASADRGGEADRPRHSVAKASSLLLKRHAGERGW